MIRYFFAEIIISYNDLIGTFSGTSGFDISDIEHNWKVLLKLNFSNNKYTELALLLNTSACWGNILNAMLNSPNKSSGFIGFC